MPQTKKKKTSRERTSLQVRKTTVASVRKNLENRYESDKNINETGRVLKLQQ